MRKVAKDSILTRFRLHQKYFRCTEIAQNSHTVEPPRIAHATKDKQNQKILDSANSAYILPETIVLRRLECHHELTCIPLLGTAVWSQLMQLRSLKPNYQGITNDHSEQPNSHQADDDDDNLLT